MWEILMIIQKTNLIVIGCHTTNSHFSTKTFENIEVDVERALKDIPNDT